MGRKFYAGILEDAWPVACERDHIWFGNFGICHFTSRRRDPYQPTCGAPSADRRTLQATIKSPVFELKKQIAHSGNLLVTECVDDGYSEKLLRSALCSMMGVECKSITDRKARAMPLSFFAS